MDSEENTPSQSTPIPESTFKVTSEMCERLVRSERKHRRRERWIRRWELNRFFWFLDEFPSQEIYRPFSDDRRNTRQEMAYHRLRQVTNWTYWSHMKSVTGLKFAAAGGLISAFFQAALGLRPAQAASEPLGWLLIAALLYVMAVLWFEFRCPNLLKRVLNKDEGYLGIEGRRWLLALVEDELRRWWAVTPYWPNVRDLDPDSSADQTVLGIMGGYGVPAFSGFSVQACAHIEKALYEYALVTSATIWRRDDFPTRFARLSPGYIIPSGRRPLMHRLHISRLSDLDANDVEGAKEGELVLRWFKSSVGIQHTLRKPKNVDMRWEAEGLARLFERDESALAFTKIIASWQNTMRPWSRLLLMLLFLASAGSFCWFVYLQVRFMIPTLM
ncbi:hypothetical protein [Pseudomonas savastanoi]|uniref:Uncharacterized protein n=1 Tax=Pseudomonas savastanoi pv. phaseolicola TaxID=319 RepID=A0ABD4B8S8_PSESH|nr:hypothetical protein [Pseudomonas savastanoi]KPY10351.1 Uncharacterized protein ALO55_04218 [Pseudomonas savastanoi pv. phaseolicola]